jgi:hypothetical protein
MLGYTSSARLLMRALVLFPGGLASARREGAPPMRFRAAVVLCVVLACVAAWCAVANAANAPNDRVWLVASDIHLNPFNDAPYPVLFGTDTNLVLFRSALQTMKREVPNPALVVLPGDFFVHNFPKIAHRNRPEQTPETTGIETMRSIAHLLAQAYPNAQFAIAMGNNDAPCGDYRVDVKDPFIAAVARIWAPLVDRHNAAPGFTASFVRGGYYTVALPVRGMRMVVLNTVLFSSQFRGTCGGGGNAAKNEMTWMNATLRATPANVRNVVMMHIPPGFDTFSTETVRGFVPWAFLQSRYNSSLIDALSNPSNRVAYALAGHMHRFDFRIVDGVPLVVFGSISPVYRNNPAFYAMHVTPDGSLADIDAYAFDEWTQAWTPARSFDRAWNVDRIDAVSLGRIHARLEGDPALRSAWDRASSGWPSNPHIMWAVWGRFWRVPWCAQTVLAGGFAQCAHIEHRFAFLVTAIVAAVVVVLACVIIVIVRSLKRSRHRV